MAKKGRGAATKNRTSGASGNRRPGSAAGRRRTPVVAPTAGPNWGMIGLASIVGVVVLALLGYIGYTVWDKSRGMTDRAMDIPGVQNYRTDAGLGRTHVEGDQDYGQSPPVGGDHNSAWETCNGVVYTEQIPDEHAVHSLEHGAIWITYRPGLPQAEIDRLAERVSGKDFSLMSPYPGLDSPISIQAWGFQLKLDSADDERIDRFIEVLRLNASVEPGATCNGGVRATGTVPDDSASGM